MHDNEGVGTKTHAESRRMRGRWPRWERQADEKHTTYFRGGREKVTVIGPDGEPTTEDRACMALDEGVEDDGDRSRGAEELKRVDETQNEKIEKRERERLQGGRTAEGGDERNIGVAQRCRALMRMIRDAGTEPPGKLGQGFWYGTGGPSGFDDVEDDVISGDPVMRLWQRETEVEMERVWGVQDATGTWVVCDEEGRKVLEKRGWRGKTGEGGG